LLAYLAARADESHSRDRLASLLWEEADEELARTSLRQALASLRKSLPASAQAALRTDTESVALDSSIIKSDLCELRGSLAAATSTSLRNVLDHYSGDLLDGLDARSAAFDDWLSHERLVLRRQVTESLQQLTALCTANDDADGALTACTRLVSLEPLNEAAHRTIMELHARRNAYAEALRQYRICRDALRRELDVAPEPATEALYRDLMRRRRAGAGSDEIEIEDVATAPVAAPAAATTIAIDSRPALRDAVVSVARLEGLLELEAVADPEEAASVAQRFQALVQQASESCGGVTDRRVGANVLTVFGVPSAYGNEAERASRAALALRAGFSEQRWPTQVEMKLRIGIAQGQILPSPALFPLTGKPTHIAHSLAARAADNQILLSDEVRHALGDRSDTVRTAVPATAAADVTSAWALNSARTNMRAADRAFVGRRPELAMILAVLDRCMTSKHGRAIVVRGEAGIGKTKLVEAVREAAIDRDAAVHHAQVFDFGQSPGRRPITALALSLCGMADDATATDRADAVRRMSGTLRAGIDQTVFLSDLIDAPLSSELEALEQAMDAATRQRGRTLALTQLIEIAARQNPLLLVVEDVHWADTDELARLGEIAAVVANCPILLMMTTRPEGDPISATWRARARGCPVTTVDLAPLADDEAHELAAHYRELPADTIEACIRRAEGYPLFLDQLLRAASSGHGTLPGSVRALIIARADRLSSGDNTALQAAAVLGHRFTTDALQSLIEDRSYDANALSEAGLLRSDGADLQFAHALFRDAIYEATLKSRRRELHLHAAAWFRTRDIALHADHLAAADHDDAAAAYADAARAEQTALRFERALTLAGKANALAREPSLLHHTSCLLGELLLQLGRTHDALTAYREALDFAIDQADHGAAHLGIASTLRIMDRHEEALDALDSAERALGNDIGPQMKARLYSLRGNLCFPLGRFDACLDAHQQAQRFAEEAGTPIELARAHSGLGDAKYQRGHIITAHRHFERCIEEARRHGLAAVLVANLPMLCVTHHFCGDFESSTKLYTEALDLVRKVGDRRSELIVHLVAASTQIMQGRFEESRTHAKLALEFAQRVGARRFQAECLGMLSDASIAAGDKEEARRLLTDALEIARDTAMTYCGPVLLSLMARATDDPAHRAAVLREGEAILAEGCVSHSYFEFYWNATDVSLETGEWSEARRYADALAAYTSEESIPWAEFVIARARLLADVGEGVERAVNKAALNDLAAGIRQMGALALLPRIEATLQAL
jgi:DNA-binding SARP family transcriptional activator/tetratricopeptide (TPR) repeat protein